MNRTVIWNLKAGGRYQESEEEKRAEGLAYIEKLKDEYNVLEVKEENNQFIITLEDK